MNPGSRQRLGSEGSERLLKASSLAASLEVAVGRDIKSEMTLLVAMGVEGWGRCVSEVVTEDVGG